MQNDSWKYLLCDISAPCGLRSMEGLFWIFAESVQRTYQLASLNAYIEPLGMAWPKSTSSLIISNSLRSKSSECARLMHFQQQLVGCWPRGSAINVQNEILGIEFWCTATHLTVNDDVLSTAKPIPSEWWSLITRNAFRMQRSLQCTSSNRRCDTHGKHNGYEIKKIWIFGYSCWFQLGNQFSICVGPSAPRFWNENFVSRLIAYMYNQMMLGIAFTICSSSTIANQFKCWKQTDRKWIRSIRAMHPKLSIVYWILGRIEVGLRIILENFLRAENLRENIDWSEREISREVLNRAHDENGKLKSVIKLSNRQAQMGWPVHSLWWTFVFI